MRAGHMVSRTPEEIALDRAFREEFVTWEPVPSQGVYDIRAARQHPWRILSRRIVEGARAGVPMETVLRTVQRFEVFVLEVYRRFRPPVAKALPRPARVLELPRHEKAA